MSTQEERDQWALNNARTFVWHELYTPNKDEAMRFYKEALDFGTEEMPMGDMGMYPMLTRNGMGVAGVWDTTANKHMKDVPPHWAVYVSVDDVDARLTKCESMGAKIVVPAMDVPTVGRMALIRDPLGAHIWLFKSEST